MSFIVPLGTAVFIVIFLILMSVADVKAPPNQVFIVSGLNKQPRRFSGTASFIVPFAQRLDKLPLSHIALNIRTTAPLITKDLIKIKLEATAELRITPTDEGLTLAAQNFLNKTEREIAESAQLLVLSSLGEATSEFALSSLVLDRSLFSKQATSAISGNLKKLGLELISFNVQNITDDQKLIETMLEDSAAKLKENGKTAGSFDNATEEMLKLVKTHTQFRSGVGFDVHQLTKERPLILGGVRLPYEKGLLGHSDADVLVHAVMDALLGAAKLADIGVWFPDTNPQWKDADSLKLAAAVADKVRSKGYEIINIDAMVIAQAPKISPHFEEMAKNIAKALDVEAESVNVKATTTEKMGFCGEGLGMAAMASALLKKTA